MNTKQEVLEFVNKNPVCWLATSESGMPHVRGLWTWFADETGIYFHTGSFKNLFAQLNNNPNVEACFYNQEANKSLRVNGTVEFIDDAKLEQRLMNERKFLQAIAKARPDSKLSIFRIAKGEAHFWSMETNLAGKEIIKL